MLDRLARGSARARARRHPARPAQGPRPQALPAAGRRGRRSARDRHDPARSRQRGRHGGADRRGRARRADRLRLRRADQGSAAVGLADPQRPSRRCCRAGAARPRSSGRSWPATTPTGVSIMELVAELDAGPVCSRSTMRDRSRRHLRHARRRAWPRSRASCSSARSTSGRRPRPQREDGVDLRREDRARGPAPRRRPATRPRRWPGACARSRRTSARGSQSGDGERLGVLAAAATPGGRPGARDARRRRRAAAARTAPRAPSSCSRSSLPASAAWPPPTTCGAGDERRADEDGRGPRRAASPPSRAAARSCATARTTARAARS